MKIVSSSPRIKDRVHDDLSPGHSQCRARSSPHSCPLCSGPASSNNNHQCPLNLNHEYLTRDMIRCRVTTYTVVLDISSLCALLMSTSAWISSSLTSVLVSASGLGVISASCTWIPAQPPVTGRNTLSRLWAADKLTSLWLTLKLWIQQSYMISVANINVLDE